jgi:hypothetical protein
VVDWQSDLAQFFQAKDQKQKDDDEKLSDTKLRAAEFFRSVAVPAFEAVKVELEKYGRDVRIGSSSDWASMSISFKGQPELEYTLKVHISPGRAMPYPETKYRDRSDGKTYRAEGFLKGGSDDSIDTITKDDVIRHLLADYKSHVER